MSTFNVPKKSEVSEKNQAIFDSLEGALGFVPNLYATYAYSENALTNYLALSNAKTSLNAKQKEVVNLAVSEVNECIRAGKASFDNKLDALAKLAKNITENRGATDAAVVDQFLSAGWTKENLVDTIVLVGDKTISNYLHKTTLVPVDFPEVKVLA